MNRPNFEPIFTDKSDYCEVSDPQPVESFIPNQALDLKELVSRFERGQRLNVHNNFAPGSNFENISDEEAMRQIQNETFDDCPPTGVYDIADVQQLKEEHEIHKREFASKMKKKRETKQEKPGESQQVNPSDPQE